MRRLNDERGATAVFVGILILVLFGLAAMVIDVGNGFWERRMLQNSADAAAIAAAQDFVVGESATAEATARDFADANNPRGAFVEEFLPEANSVTVVTKTGDSPEARLQSWLASIIGHDDYFARARARAAWGILGGGITIPIAICERNWDYFTEDGKKIPSGPPAHLVEFAVPNPAAQPVADYQDCSNPSFDTYPGGFGFLERDADCMATTYVEGDGTWVDGSPGNNAVDPHSSCGSSQLFQMLRDIIDNDKTVLIPIFDAFEGSGEAGRFRLVGYGAFKLEGYKILAATGGQNSYGMDPGECSGPKSCLKGYYEYWVDLGAEDLDGGTDFGAYGVRLTH